MPQVKICGLTRVEDVRLAEDAGAAFLGVILAGGPRHLSPERARHVLGPRRHGVRRVAVFGDQPAAEVVVLARELDLDVLQLHGTRDAAEVAAIARDTGRSVWPVVRVAGSVLPAETATLAAIGGTIVLDAHVLGQLGGTGVALDWSGLRAEVAALRAAVPGLTVILAGGLRAGNVGEAVRLLSPEVVDVSSGVESAPGVKDPERVHQFVEAAHRAAEKS